MGLAVAALLGFSDTAHANNTQTVNTSGNAGASGNLFATPPGSCTAVPSGALGDCGLRGAAAAGASAGFGTGTLFSADDFSDVDDFDLDGDGLNNDVDPCALDGAVTVAAGDADSDLIDDQCDTGSLRDVGQLATITAIGKSFVPETCMTPACGFLLRGDVLMVDENGDGEVNGAWIDDGDGIREAGEVDRYRAEQFSWGASSLVKTEHLDDPNLIAQGNYPTALSRMMTRLSLGTDALGAQYTTTATICDGQVDNADCTDGFVDGPATAPVVPGGGLPSVATLMPAVFGHCDPDRFTAIVDSVARQRALDNCLWRLAATPLTNFTFGNAIDPTWDPLDGNRISGEEGLYDLNTRDQWISQQVLKIVESVDADTQDFYQTVYVAAELRNNPDPVLAEYQNDWQVFQRDIDPNTAVNGLLIPPTVTSGANLDTYENKWFVQARSTSTARDCTATSNNPADCIPGSANPTLDPFWGETVVRDALFGATLDTVGAGSAAAGHIAHDYDKNLDEAVTASVGQAAGIGAMDNLTFLYYQDVNGFFSTCMDCNNAERLAAGTNLEFPWFVDGPEFQPYTSNWRNPPTIIHAP